MRGFDGTLPSRQETGIGIVAVRGPAALQGTRLAGESPDGPLRPSASHLFRACCGHPLRRGQGRLRGSSSSSVQPGHEASWCRPGRARRCLPSEGRHLRVRACAQGVTRTQVLRSRLTAADRSSAFPRHIRKGLPVWCRSRLDAGQACRLAADAPSDCRQGSPIAPVGTHADHCCHLAGEARRSARSEQAAPARAEVAQSATTSRPSTPGFTLAADADQAISSPVRVDVPAMPYRTSS